MNRAERAKRNNMMVDLYISGCTLQQIGECFSLTRNSVWLVVNKKHGLKRYDGGKSAVTAQRTTRQNIAREAKSQARWGCSHSDYVALRDHPSKPVTAYRYQERTARDRGVEFNLKLIDWWGIWQGSGHWHQRGRGPGYCMCRIGDVGPYAVGNVYIATGSQNIKDYWADKRSGRRPQPTYPSAVLSMVAA